MYYRKICVKLFTYQNYTKMHGPKNIKKYSYMFVYICWFHLCIKPAECIVIDCFKKYVIELKIMHITSDYFE
jgi:hypothetical protein